MLIYIYIHVITSDCLDAADTYIITTDPCIICTDLPRHYIPVPLLLAKAAPYTHPAKFYKAHSYTVKDPRLSDRVSMSRDRFYLKSGLYKNSVMGYVLDLVLSKGRRA